MSIFKPVKSIFRSKVFWANVAAGAATYGGYLPSRYAAVVVPVANILLRFLTTEPVSLSGS